jgi:hypothetical protein
MHRPMTGDPFTGRADDSPLQYRLIDFRWQITDSHTG